MAKFQEKERILKAAREKQEVPYKGAPIRLTADFSMETQLTRREWQETFQVMKSKVLQPRLFYPARLSFKMEGKTRSIPDKRKLKEYTSGQTSTSRHAKWRERETGTQVQKEKIAMSKYV